MNNRLLKFVLTAIAALVAVIASAKTGIIAHRGYWTCAGSAQNSIAALMAADRIGAYGSEFDVYITKDGQTVVHHDPAVDGIDIETSDYNDMKKSKLQNEEPLPTLREYLEWGKKVKTRLILEIKPHKSKDNESRCVDEVLRQVAALGVADRVEYISFSMHVCELLAQKAAGSSISYLGGDVAPSEIKAKGLTGIDYFGAVFAAHPEWIDECHKLGLTVNVWTIDDLDTVDQFVKAGVDYITTNKPVEALKLAN